jgi:osmotically-inducible protein OsmY
MNKEHDYPIILDEFFRNEEQKPLDFDLKKTNDRIQTTDDSIEENIYNALWKDSILRVTDIDEIKIHVNNSVVFMSGHILGSTNRQRIEKALQTVPGIYAIRSNLVMDDELTREVAGSLAELEHIHECKFFTGVSHGVVVISGNVSTIEIRGDAEKCISQNPKVRGIINRISVPNISFELQDNRFLQPIIGTEMYFRDGIFGIVQQAVINPYNRRVQSMVLQGHFNNLRQNLGILNKKELPTLEQKMVIPMSAMRYLTIHSGTLNISSSDATADHTYNSSMYFSPDKSWEPPFPYKPSDILIPIEYEQSISLLK